METVFSHEQLSRMVKGFCVENITPNGNKPNGDKELMEAVLYLGQADRMVGLSDGGAYRIEGFTRVALVPLSGQAVKADKMPGKYKNDVALCFSYFGNKVDQSNRQAVMRSLVVMSPSDATDFLEKVKTSPSLVYDLLTHVNNGPIKRYDGSPMDIKCGRVVEILPNSRTGGNISTRSESVPFAFDYKPNPLFKAT